MKIPFWHRTQTLITLTLLCLLILAGCTSPAITGQPAQELPTSADIELDITQEAATETIVPQVTNTPSESVVLSVPSTEMPASPVVAEALPTPRQGLEATDPAHVNLASGQTQVVEFFAFW